MMFGQQGIEILVDNDDGPISTEALEAFHQEILTLDDDILPDHYMIEVSSVGIERPLKVISEKEGIVADDDALHIIAQKADGAMRDALSIFDRVVSYCGKNLTRQAVNENLNVLDFEYYITITNLLLENKIPELLMAYNDILAKGFDGHHFIAGLASHFRDLMVCKNPATLVLLETGEQAQILYQEQSIKTSLSFLLQGIELANDCDLKFKNSQNQRLLVELSLMQIASISFDGEKKKLNPI